jgi:arsenate reductase
MTTTLYGFKSCDTVKKARKWLDDKGVAHRFFDYRVEKLPETEKAGIDAKKARKMILSETNLIKRPVLDTGGTLVFGFKADAFASATGK